MGQALRIRPAEECDISALAGLMAELGYPISLEDMRDRLAFVASSECDELFVAEDADQVVGLIGVQVAEFIHRVGRYGRITALVVSACHRRKGIGSTLLEHVESCLRAQGIFEIRVDAGFHRKDDAYQFYEARGFTATGARFTKRLDM